MNYNHIRSPGSRSGKVKSYYPVVSSSEPLGRRWSNDADTHIHTGTYYCRLHFQLEEQKITRQLKKSAQRWSLAAIITNLSAAAVIVFTVPI